MTDHDKDFLDAFSSGNDEIVHNKMKVLNTDTFFEDDFFKFELNNIEYKKDNIEYSGNLYVPDLEKHNKTIEGNLVGKIILHSNGSYSLNFVKISYDKGKEIEYDVFEFCSGLEYELDNFIDYVVQELR